MIVHVVVFGVVRLSSVHVEASTCAKVPVIVLVRGTSPTGRCIGEYDSNALRSSRMEETTLLGAVRRLNIRDGNGIATRYLPIVLCACQTSQVEEGGGLLTRF